MDRLYERINWENEPSLMTPINDINLNKMDSAIYNLDGRTIEMDTTKANQSDALLMFNSISYDEKTGKFTFTRMNGTKVVVDTLLEKVVTNFRYDPTTQQLILTTPEGESRIDLSALITQYEFEDSSAIKFDVVGGKVVASLIDGGVKAQHLQPNFLADCETAQQSAGASANRAEVQAIRSEVAADRAEASAGKVTNDFVESELDTLTKSKEGGIVVKKMYGGVEQETLQGFNHIKYPYYNGTSYTTNGITFTVNEEDGTVTANGTATANAPYTCVARAYSDWYLKPSLYYLTGCPEGGGSNIYRLSLQGTNASGSSENIAIDYGDGISVNIDEESATRPKQIQIIINNGQTVNNLVFKPMLMDLYGEYPTLDYYEKPSNGKGMPSYEYPSEIKNVDVNITSRTANILPFPYYANNPTTSRGVTFSYDANGVVKGEGTAESTQPLINLTSTNYEIKDNKYYALINDGDAINGFAIIYFYAKGTTTLKNVDIEVTYEDGVVRHYTQNNLNLYFGSVIRKYCKFKVTTSSSEFSCVVQARYKGNVVVNNEIIKPMLVEVAEDGTYPTKYTRNYITEADTDIQLRAIEVTLYDDPLYNITYSVRDDDEGMFWNYYVADELRFENDKFYIVRRTKEFDLKNYQSSIIRSSGNDGEYTNCFRWTLDTYSRIKNQSVRGYTNVNLLRKGGGSTELKKGFGFLNINSSGGILLYLSLPKTVTTVEEAKTYSVENNIKLLTFADTEYIEEISNDDAIKLLGLKSWDEVTRITQESDMKVPLTIGYGSSDGMAQAIRGKNLGLANELKINEMTSALLSATALSEEE